jgi:hypothetical protein
MRRNYHAYVSSLGARWTESRGGAEAG